MSQFNQILLVLLGSDVCAGEPHISHTHHECGTQDLPSGSGLSALPGLEKDPLCHQDFSSTLLFFGLDLTRAVIPLMGDLILGLCFYFLSLSFFFFFFFFFDIK